MIQNDDLVGLRSVLETSMMLQVTLPLFHLIV